MLPTATFTKYNIHKVYHPQTSKVEIMTSVKSDFQQGTEPSVSTNRHNGESKGKQQDDAAAIHEAHSLGFDVDRNRDYYRQWAEKYDADTMGEKYVGPEVIAQFYDMVRAEFDPETPPQDAKVLDMGCGTGLSGPHLRARHYRNVDGCDLSPEMIEKAKSTNCYNKLVAGVDLNVHNEEMPDKHYDGIISSGVFTLGHVMPSCLYECIRLVRKGGLVVFNTRIRYARDTDLANFLQGMEEKGEIKLVKVAHDAPFIGNENAHYWAVQVL